MNRITMMTTKIIMTNVQIIMGIVNASIPMNINTNMNTNIIMKKKQQPITLK